MSDNGKRTKPKYEAPAVAKFWGSKRLLNKASPFLEILKGVFPPREVMAREYPPPSDSIRIYFYYAMRFRDLLRRHGRHVWRLLRGDEEMQALAKRENDIAPLKDWLMSP